MSSRTILKGLTAALGRRWIAAGIIVVATLCLLAPWASAEEPRNYTRANFDAWMRQYAGAKPEFKPGDVLGAADLERIRPFAPPGYFDRLNFPELKMPIIAPRAHTPRSDFVACTEKYQSQVKLAPDGALANFVCGQPFADAALDPQDPLSGLKAAWNFEYRWQNYGLFGLSFFSAWDRFGGTHAAKGPMLIEPPPSQWTAGVKYQTKLPSDASRYYRGGGTFERTASSFYQRVYFSHLAQLADKGGVLGTPNAGDFIWKDFTGFYSPFDVRGTVFIVYRYADPHRADDAWVYDPKLRRVRRISAEAKSDSLLGTDVTFDDFYTFSGHQLQWKWKFLGWKDLLCMMDLKEDVPYLYGPDGDIPSDVWSVRRFAVVERIPTQSRYPYSSVVMFWDAENWHPWQSLSFNRDKKLWKILTYVYKWSEDFKEWSEINHGVETSVMTANFVTDLQNRRATLTFDFGSGYPDASLEHVKKLFDINTLEEIHR